MSKHQDYIFRERSQDLDHAVGFAGQVNNLAGNEPKTIEGEKRSYYDKSHKDQDGGNYWLNFIPILSLVILLAFAKNFNWGVFSILISLLFIIGFLVLGYLRNKR